MAQIFEAPQASALAGARHRHALQWAREAPREQRHLGLESLARQLSFRRNISRGFFANKTGERLNEYITRVRIQNATDGLRTTQISVKAIGAACGFSTRVIFCRVFRQVVGQTPQDYRAHYYRATLEIERRPKTVLAEGAQFVGGVSTRPSR